MIDLDKELKDRLWKLPTDFRFRIEYGISYGADVEYEIWLSEQALLVYNTLREENQIFFFSTYGREEQYRLVPDLDIRQTKESLDQTSSLALQYIRNPTGVSKFPLQPYKRGDGENQ